MGNVTKEQLKIYQEQKVAEYQKIHPEAKDIPYEVLADMFVITPQELMALQAQKIADLKDSLEESQNELDYDEKQLESGTVKGTALSELYNDIDYDRKSVAKIKGMLENASKILEALKIENPELTETESHGR